LLTNKGPFVSITHTLTLAAYEHFLTNHRKYPKVSSQLSKYIYISVRLAEPLQVQAQIMRFWQQHTNRKATHPGRNAHASCPRLIYDSF